MTKEDDVLSFLRRNGPSHPVQVSKVLSADSFTASVVLSEMMDKGLVKKTHKRVGGSRLFYIPGQEEDARKMIVDSMSIIEKKLYNSITQSGFVFQEDLDAQSRFIIEELRDVVVPLRAKIDGQERVIWKHYKFENSEIEKRVLRKQEKRKEEPKQETKTPKPEESKREEFSLAGFKVISSEKDSQIVEVETPIKQRYFVKRINKARINEKDLSMVHSEVISRKMPAIIITKAKLTKGAKEFLEKELNALVKLVSA